MEEEIAVQRRICMAILATAAILSLLKFHGYSIAMWHPYIDGSPQVENILGQAQPHRSDDYFAELPLAFSQIRQHPQFQSFNATIFLGENIPANAAKVPAIHWTTLFKPTCWGFFLGPDIGMGWNWWFLFFGLFLSQYLWLSELTNGKHFVSGAVSFLTCLSPFAQFWSFHYLETVIAFFLCLFALEKILSEKNQLNPKIVWPLVLSWSGLVFALNLYPPFQVPLAWMFLGLFVFHFIPKWSLLSRLEQKKVAQQLGFVFLLVAAFLVYFYIENRDVLHSMSDTAYPGARRTLGGGMNLWEVFLHNFFPNFSPTAWTKLGICYHAGFYMLFPLLISWRLISFVLYREPISRIELTLIGMLVAFLAYQLLSWPKTLAQLTLMDRSMEQRSQLATGLINSMLLAAFLDRPPGVFQRKARWIGVFLVGSCGTALWFIFQKYLTEILPAKHLPIGLLVFLAVSTMLLSQKTQKAALVTLILVSGLHTLGFNPFVRGGSKFIFNNELSRNMLQVASQQAPTQGRWIVYNEYVLSNLPRALGLPVLAGTQSYPQQSFWRSFDFNGSQRDVWNRFAHVFYLFDDSTTRKPIISSPFWNQVTIQINPDNCVLEELGVDYLLVAGDSSMFEKSESFRPLYKSPYGRSIYGRILKKIGEKEAGGQPETGCQGKKQQP